MIVLGSVILDNKSKCPRHCNIVSAVTHHPQRVDDVLGRGLVPRQVVDDLVHLEVRDLGVGAASDPAIHQARSPETHGEGSNLNNI